MVEMPGIAPGSERLIKTYRPQAWSARQVLLRVRERTSARSDSLQAVAHVRRRNMRLDLSVTVCPFPRSRSGRPAHQFALGEGRGKGRSAERRSDRTANLRDDVGSCHGTGQDLRAVSARSACHVVKRPSSMLIHPLLLVASATDLPHNIPCLDGLALIMDLFSTTERKRDFDASGQRVERQGH